MAIGAVVGGALAAGGAMYSAKKNASTQKEIAKNNTPALQANAQAASTNTNQYTPYGSSEWQITGQNADGTNIYENRQTLSPEMQQQFDLGNQNTMRNMDAQGNALDQINYNSQNPLFADDLGGSIDYGAGKEGAQNYANSLSYSAGSPATMGAYNPVSAEGYDANTYQGKGYDANTYQGKGYEANTYQGKGYDANTYQGKGYDANTYNANTYQGQGYQARELGQAAQANAAQAGTERASYGQIQDNLKLSGDALKSDLDTTRDAYYNTQKAYLDPQWENDSRAMETKLANQGVAMNSAAYNDAMSAFNRNREFAYNNARNTSITGAGAEQSRLFGLDLQSGQFANNAQQQGFDQSAWNAGQANNAAIANAQMQTNVNMANTDAKNATRQFNANNYNTAQRYNADANNQANQWNAGAMNDASQWNTGALNDASQYGATAQNQANQWNTGALNDASQYGATARNNTNQFNAGMDADYGQFNAGAMNDFSQFNANLNNSAQNNAYNARMAAAEQNNQALNQEMNQLFSFRNQPIDEYNALRQGTAMPTPSFDNGGGSSFNAAQAMQSSAQQQMAAANNQAQGNANFWGTVGNVVGNTDWSKIFNWGKSGDGSSSSDYTGSAYQNWIK